MADDSTTIDSPSEATSPETKPEALGDAGKKALDTERRERKAAEKRAAETEAKLKQLEDRDKSELQRQIERAEKFEQELNTLRTESTRLRVAARYGVAESDLDLLGSGTEDEIETRAKRIQELTAAKTPAQPVRPVESLRSGAVPHSVTPADDSPRSGLMAAFGADLGLS